jgi:NitT/TauT family transport system substrate-binding protein
MNTSLNRRNVLQWGAGAAAAMGGAPTLVRAQEPVKYLHDWRWEGPGTAIAMAEASGAFASERLGVQINAGTGSAATVAKLASNEFDVGLGDFGSLVEFAAKNPGQAMPQIAYVLYERMPAAVFIKRDDRGRAELSSLAGKTLGAPPFDGGRKLWPLFAELAGIGEVKWVNLEAPKREEAFVKGQVDAITGFYFTSDLNIERQGLGARDYTSVQFHEKGLRLYGNALMVSPQFAQRAAAAQRFVRAYHAGVRAALADTRSAVATLQQNYEKSINPQLEWRRARLAFDNFVLTPSVRETGLGTVDMKRIEQGIATLATTLKLSNRPSASSIARADWVSALRDRNIA